MIKFIKRLYYFLKPFFRIFVFYFSIMFLFIAILEHQDKEMIFFYGGAVVAIFLLWKTNFFKKNN